MKSRVWLNLIMVVLVSGLLLTVSCGQKTVVSPEATIEDKTDVDAQKKADEAARKAAEEAERIRKQKLEDERAKEQAMKDALAKEKQAFVNQDVLFAYDSSELDGTAVMLLKEKASWLKANNKVTVTIEGHCDERGTTEYNLALGERRASAVKAYLVNLGISPARLYTISYGEEQPIASGTSEGAYRLNRRAHFSLN